MKKTTFIVFILACLHVQNLWSAVGTTEINCQRGSDISVGSVQEGYEGDIEIITNIRPDDRVVLESHYFPIGVTFLTLVYSDGDTNATVRTNKPLDAEVLSEMKNIRKLNVADVNDNAPIFQSKTYSVTVSETVAVGSYVLWVQAEDADVSPSNNILTYSIVPSAPDEFELGNDGNIKLKKHLDFNVAESHIFTVEAKDPYGLNDRANVTITVMDYDNLNPYFHHSLYKASIEENQVGIFSVVTPEAIKAQDGDQGINEPVVYSITAVHPNKYQPNFAIGQNTGVISVTTALDREEIDQITVYLQAAQQDDTSKTANTVLYVTIVDVDDNPPKFEQDQYTATIPENSPLDQVVFQTRVTDLDMVEAQDDPPSSNTATAEVNVILMDENDNSPRFTSAKYEGKVYSNQTTGMPVVKVEAADLDEGPNGEISYAIEFGNEEGYFDIDGNTGEITLLNKIPLMENKILQFALYVTAKDGGVITRSTSALVDIKAPGDSRPQFLQKTYQGQVEEEQSGADIVKIDFLSIDPIIPVTLTVESEADKFSIDQNTGVLSTKVKLDYELKSSYIVQMSITDGTNRDEASVQVDVLDINDNSPMFVLNPARVTIPEDLTVGDNVTSVQARDADSDLNGEVWYTLLGGAGRFSIDEETGVITVAAPLDREDKDEYNLDITARDQGRPSRSTSITLDISITDINDNAPIFSKQQYEVTVSEHALVGADVLNVTAVDKDEGSNAVVTYHIIRQEPPSTPPIFSIDAVTGSIHLAEKLDYSRAKRFTLQVEGRDGGSPVLTGSAVVIVWVEDVNDKLPEFSMEQYNVAVYENLPTGAALVSLEVTDQDEGGFSKGFFILDSDTFAINGQGVILLRTNATLDRETKDNYILQTVAVDQPVDGQSATAQVNITVLDVNDNNPEFLALPELTEIREGAYTSSSPGVVCVISAADSDIGDNGRVTISTSSHSDLFQFREDGTLLAVRELDRETADVYDLVIVAMDHGIPQRNNITTLRVSITDINDNAPVFSSKTYSKSILVKDTKIGDLLLTLHATDRDAGNNSLLTYSFSEDTSVVSLDAETGDVTLTSDLSDLTEDTVLNLTAKVTDHGTPSKTATAEVLIDIRIVSLTEGMAFASSYNFSIKENEPAATKVGTVKASTGSSQVTVSYRMKLHEDVFSVDADGTIKALRALDKEMEEWYILTVEATDSRTPPNTAETMVRVQVENVNEAPEFTAEKYEAEIFSISPYKFPIVKVQASDPDVGESSELQYALLKPTTLLDVDHLTGQLYVLDASSFGGSQVACEVKATDKHGLSTTTTVQVNIKETATISVVVISLNQPVFTVEKKLPDIQESLEKALGWAVKILSVEAESQNQRFRESTTKTFISFIAMDSSGAVIPPKEVKEMLLKKQAAVTAELEKVFGSGLDIELEEGSGNSGDSGEVAFIALGVILAVFVVAFVVLMSVYVVKFRKTNKDTDSDKESFNMERHGSFKHRSSKSENSNYDKNPEVVQTKEEQKSHRSDSEKEDKNDGDD
ncbi:Protocadherin Fat 4 FAT tumor suppressor -like protein 4 [Triplophysa tibetana]|uniref:Protocadherin Fat 4 FAT tumor suppressor-like protein 4 n=1 Tax=Triplophysa tibetana TaxID=1572043 RepID=A0A5A9PLR5_9TELE|nr:Protocadherin Fat 4 FAT tumor suppressor -like protein 4 [Triplophysa tibetana]